MNAGECKVLVVIPYSSGKLALVMEPNINEFFYKVVSAYK